MLPCYNIAQHMFIIFVLDFLFLYYLSVGELSHFSARLLLEDFVRIVPNSDAEAAWLIFVLQD